MSTVYVVGGGLAGLSAAVLLADKGLHVELIEGAPQAGWWLHFVILREDRSRRTLIGSAGYKGPPSSDGTVEVGYGIVSEYQRQGYASEALRGLLSHAFSFPAVTRAIAETLPSLIPSIGVLKKTGFRLIDESSEPGVIRFELTRAEYEAKNS